MIEHHYAYAESALDRQVQNFKPTYNYNDENERFRQAGKVWSETNEKDYLLKLLILFSLWCNYTSNSCSL